MKSLLILMLMTSSAAFAQGKKQVQDPSLLYSACTNYVDCSMKIAKERKAFYAAEIERVAGLGSGFKFCEVDRMNFLYSYYDWYVSAESELRALDRQFLEVDEKVKAKVEWLQSTAIDVIAVKDQTSSTQKVDFTKIVAYLKRLNDRIGECTKDQVPGLLKLQENPHLNKPLEVAHSQIIAAVNKASANINAGLKEQGGSFSVQLVQGQDCKFDYVLKYSPVILDRAYDFNVSLLKGDKVNLGLSEAEKWKAVTAGNRTLRDQNIDGQRRYRQMQGKLRDATCRKDNWDALDRSQTYLPLVTESNHIAAKGNTLDGNRMDVDDFCNSSNEEIIELFNQALKEPKVNVFDKKYGYDANGVGLVVVGDQVEYTIASYVGNSTYIVKHRPNGSMVTFDQIVYHAGITLISADLDQFRASLGCNK